MSSTGLGKLLVLFLLLPSCSDSGDGPADVGFWDAAELVDLGPKPNPDAGLPYVPGTEPMGDSRVVVGSGTRRFEEIKQGDVLPWTFGIQGGHHIYGGFTLSSSIAQTLTVDQQDQVVHRYQFTLQGSSEPIATAEEKGLLVPRGQELISYGIQVILRESFTPEAVSGRPGLLELTVEIPGGDTLKSSAWIDTRCCE